MEVKFLDLKKINGRFEREFKQVLQTVLESGYYIGSSQIRIFVKILQIIAGLIIVWA